VLLKQIHFSYLKASYSSLSSCGGLVSASYEFPFIQGQPFVLVNYMNIILLSRPTNAQHIY